MTKVANILKILKILEEKSNNGIFVSAKELSEMLNIEARTIVNYISGMKEAGIEIDSLRGLGGGYMLRGMYLTSQEIYALEEALKYLEKSDFEHIREFKVAIDKLNHIFNKNIK